MVSFSDPIAALEVYVRRAYRMYHLLGIEYQEGDGEDDGESPHVVSWKFKLGSTQSTPQTPRIFSPT